MMMMMMMMMFTVMTMMILLILLFKVTSGVKLYVEPSSRNVGMPAVGPRRHAMQERSCPQALRGLWPCLGYVCKRQSCKSKPVVAG